MPTSSLQVMFLFFSPGDGVKSWLHGDDSAASGHLNFASFSGTLYERIKLESEYNSQSEYLKGSRVYKDGFVYESTNDLKAANWTGQEKSAGEIAKLNDKFYRLLVDLEAAKVDNSQQSTQVITLSLKRPAVGPPLLQTHTRRVTS